MKAPSKEHLELVNRNIALRETSALLIQDIKALVEQSKELLMLSAELRENSQLLINEAKILTTFKRTGVLGRDTM